MFPDLFYLSPIVQNLSSPHPHELIRKKDVVDQSVESFHTISQFYHLLCDQACLLCKMEMLISTFQVFSKTIYESWILVGTQKCFLSRTEVIKTPLLWQKHKVCGTVTQYWEEKKRKPPGTLYWLLQSHPSLLSTLLSVLVWWPLWMY